MHVPARARLHRYVDYLLEALKRRDLFAWLKLDPAVTWRSLLFRDRYNWQGIVAILDPALRSQMATRPGALSQVAFPQGFVF